VSLVLRVNTKQLDSIVDIQESTKGSTLTNVELDSNFQVLNSTIFSKAPKANPTFTGVVTIPDVSNSLVAFDSTYSGGLPFPTSAYSAESDYLADKNAINLASLVTHLKTIPYSTNIVPSQTAVKYNINTGTYTEVKFTTAAARKQAQVGANTQTLYSGVDLGSKENAFANLYVGEVFVSDKSIVMGGNETGETPTVIGAEPATGGLVLPTNTAIGTSDSVIPANLASTELDKGFAATNTSRAMVNNFTFTGLNIVTPPYPVMLNADGSVSRCTLPNRFIGFVTTSAQSGNVVPVQVGGVVTGISGYTLATGAEYYVGTTGSLSTVNDAENAKIGVGLGSGSLFLYTTSTIDTYLLQYNKLEKADLSVATQSPGSNSLTYNNTTGVFDFTPTDLSAYAPLASPTFTGAPLAPTATAGTNTTQLATTQFVRTEVAALVDSAPTTLDTLNEIAASISDNADFAGSVTSSLALKASLDSPTFTGSVTAPTPSDTSNDDTIATTAFVRNTSPTLNSPTLTGIPTAPTAAASVNNTQIATTAYVTTAVAQGGGASNLDGGLANTTRTLATHHFDGGNA